MTYHRLKQLSIPGRGNTVVWLQDREAFAFALTQGCWLRAQKGQLVGPAEAKRLLAHQLRSQLWLPSEPEWSVRDLQMALTFALQSQRSVVVLAFSNMEGVIAGRELVQASNRWIPSRLFLSPAGLCLEISHARGRFRVQVVHSSPPAGINLDHPHCTAGAAVEREEEST